MRLMVLLVRLHVHQGLLFEKGDVFTDYVDFFFKVKDKAEADGNEGLRSLAKLLLNSLWGKLGQRSYAEREWITDVSRRQYLWEKFESGEYKLLSIEDKSDARVYVTYQKNEDLNNLRDTAHQLAAYVSMWGRVILHRKILSVHGQNCGYCDTDSGIIRYRRGTEIPYMGQGLGMLANEITKLGKGMINPEPAEVIKMAPKSYSIEIKGSDGEIRHKVVVKGFEVSYGNSKIINFQNMKSLVFNKYGINGHLKSLGLLEEEINEDLYELKTLPRLQFISSAARNELVPTERYIEKRLRAGYTKGEVIVSEPRLIKPYGKFEPGEKNIYNCNDFIE